MVGILVTDIYPGAKFQQPGSESILVVDKIEDGLVYFYNIKGEDKSPESSDDFTSFISALNMAGYQKIN